MELTAGPRRRTGARDSDGMAVTSFALGLIGLLVLNIVLGPIALVLAVRSLKHGTVRRSRAMAGLVLGIADVVVFAALVAADNAPLTPEM
jgi:threonine/homoserine/homoserine lactone efflux protein